MQLKRERTIGTDYVDPIPRKAEAVGALLQYLIRRVRDGEYEVLDVVLHAGWAGYDFEPHFVALLGEASPVPLKQAVILASLRVPWNRCGHADRGDLIQLWAAAASAVPHTSAIVRSVVEALLQIACEDHLRPAIPVGMWSWLNKRSYLPPGCLGHSWGARWDVFQIVRGLGDIKILKSYLLLVWSEWEVPYIQNFDNICAVIKENFVGTGIERHQHRADLLQRLDEILGHLDLGYQSLRQQRPNLRKKDVVAMEHQYGRLKELLLEVDREVVDV